MNWKRVGKALVPPPLRRGLRALRGGEETRFTGPYATWEEAASAAGGWDAPAILEKVRAAAHAVRRGEAAFERDSVAFAEREAWPHLAVLERAAAARGGRLHVLDFGGSLGSTYHQVRADLERAGVAVTWSVVEQPAFVAAGNAEFATPSLRWFATVEEAVAAAPPDVALLSSVLQYLPDPGGVARRIAAARPRTILVDRTPAHEERASIFVQHVPASIYRASYPFRIFHRPELPALFGDAWRLAAELPGTPFEALERATGARYVAFALERA